MSQTPPPEHPIDGGETPRARGGSAVAGTAADGHPVFAARGSGADGAEAMELRPAPRSPYARMGENTSVRNVVWALGLTMGVVAVVAMLFFGVGNTPKRTVPSDQRVDVAASAQRAQGLASFPLVVPELGSGWTAKQARYEQQQDPRWSLRYSSPSNQLVTLTEAQAITPSLLQDAVPGARSDGTTTIRGVTCETYALGAGGGTADRRAVSCPGEGWGIVVSGATDLAQLTQFADAAIASTAR